MSKKKNKISQTVAPQETPKPTRPDTANIFSLPFFLTVLTLLTEWIPEGDAGDPMFNQWLYLSIITAITSLTIFFSNDIKIKEAFNQVFRRAFNLVYLLFISLAIISSLWAYNSGESYATLPLMLVTLFQYFNLALLLYGRKDLFMPVAYAMGTALFFQTLYTTVTMIQQIGTARIDRIVMLLTLYAGNKNCLAASMMIKAPFLFALIHQGNRWVKVFAASIFTLLTFSVIILSSRESLINLILQSILFLVFILFTAFSDKKMNTVPVSLAFLLLPLGAGYLGSAAAIKEAKKFSSEKELTSDALARLSTIGLDRESSSYRIDQWKNAAGYMMAHPLTGAGIGNWKIMSLPNEKYSLNFISSKHAHNDFLQMGAELGIPGLVLYLALYILLAVAGFNLMFRQPDKNVRDIAFFLVATIAAYSIDALLQFPQERPVVQVLFMISAAFLISLYAAHFPLTGTSKLTPKIAMASLLIFLAPCIWALNRMQESAKVQMVYLADFVKDKPTSQWFAQDDPFPAWPDLAMTVVPVDLIKSRYAIEAKNFDEAKRLLASAKKANPNTPIHYFMEALMYKRMGSVDSTISLSLKSIEYRPRIPNNYQMLAQGWLMTNDTGVINRSYRAAKTVSQDELLEALYFKRCKELPEMASFLPGMAKQASENRKIENELNINLELATYYFERKSYDSAFMFCERATKKFPKNGTLWQNMGLIRYTQARYAEAIPYFDKVLALTVKSTGFPELLKGRCLQNLNRLPEACQWFQQASSAGNQEAAQLYNANCAPQ
ncbi:MAG TPA: O-antigen ligase family protein [Chitinophagaceae bacterium]|nr:O-antigen ligase family protein [Chitinophagaceae bacterium]